jgi:hypothetical protein
LVPSISVWRGKRTSSAAFLTEQEYLAQPQRPPAESESDAAAVRLYWLLVGIAVIGSLGIAAYYNRHQFRAGYGLKETFYEIAMGAGLGLALLFPAVQLGVAVLALMVIAGDPAAYFPLKSTAVKRILILTGWMIGGTLAGTGVMFLAFQGLR